ncbi:hypothetical protein TRAPUB_11058 [Trametes pubescens]|uniref:F-box domain-containing protein n=1 Tax=Trametes pubescens TaxID=154538 RepID=A0A1M2VXQ9_TRAPU|nr:hypothetical protein TRAPUB_11058 [Trametes pubescens]
MQSLQVPILRRIFSHCELETLLRSCRPTCLVFLTAVDDVLKDRVDEVIGWIAIDVEAMRRVMRGSRAYIGGSLPLTLFSPVQFAPENADLFVPASAAAAVINHLTTEEGYYTASTRVVTPIVAIPADAEQDSDIVAYGAGLQQVTELQRGSKIVHVLAFPDPPEAAHGFDVLSLSWTTLLFTFVTADYAGCAYPTLTLMGRGLFHMERFMSGMPGGSSNHLLNAYADRGFDFAGHPSWWFARDTEQCPRGWSCPFTRRRLGDGGPSALKTPSASLPLATIKSVYITNIHPSLPRGPRRSPQLTHEPRLLYIPAWLAAYLALYELELANSPPLDEAVEAPPALHVVRLHGPTPKKPEFSIHFSSCGGRLFALVNFPADGRARSYAEAAQGSQRQPNPSWSATAPRHGGSPPPLLCRATNALGPHAHINSWKNGSNSFVERGGMKEVRLSAMPWPTPESYCLEIRLGGGYFASLRKPQAQADHRPRGTYPQMSLPPSPPVSNAETTTTLGADSELDSSEPPRHPTGKRRGHKVMLSIPPEFLFQPLTLPVPEPNGIHAGGANVGRCTSESDSSRGALPGYFWPPRYDLTATIGGERRRLHP